MKPFLTAEWLYLANITYAVDPSVLEAYLPKGLELDIVNGKAFVGLLPFSFNNTRLKNLRVPFHVNFPEMNLRFYVKRGQKRGVVFIREYVPKFLVALVANVFYGERYSLAGMKTTMKMDNEDISLKYEVKAKGKAFSIEMLAANKPFVPAEGTTEHYFKELEYGFTSGRAPVKFYSVHHPQWETFPLKELRMNIDFGCLYGKDWDFLNGEKPYNSMLVKGSAVKMFPHQPLHLLG